MERSEVRFGPDGERCAATFYRPGGVGGRGPCVVMAHGVTLTRLDGIPDYAERFAAAGFVALAFDYRHWGDSEGEPRRWVSLRRQLEDWRAAVAYVRTLEGVDQERVAVWGMSLGGGHALLTAAADRRVAAVVALAPMTDGVANLLEALATECGSAEHLACCARGDHAAARDDAGRWPAASVRGPRRPRGSPRVQTAGGHPRLAQ